LSVASSSEVLANGMTATAGFAILSDDLDNTENSGTASLAGEFGMLTVGYSYASSAADKDSDLGTQDGIHEGQTAFTVSYALGDLVCSAGKVNVKDADTSPNA
jgi:hypothetical protein